MSQLIDNDGKYEKQKKSVTKFFYWSFILLFAFLFLKYLLPVLFPFVLAYALAWLLDRPISWMRRKTGLPRAVSATLFVLVILLVLGTVIAVLGTSLFGWLGDAFELLPKLFTEGILPTIDYFFESLENWVAGFDPETAASFDTAVNDVLLLLSDGIQKLSGVVIGGIAGLITGVPQFLMKTLVMFIATVFISSDFRTVKRFLCKLLPESMDSTMREAGKFFGHTVPKYMLSYLMILGLTFSELWLGFGLLGITSAPMIAFFVAILDILPVLGTGTVLIPWTVFSLLQGRLSFAAGMGALYLTITVVRQIIEPRLVGKQIKLHPVLTFAGMLTGLAFFGFWGLILCPLALAFIRQLNEAGIIHIRALDSSDDPFEEDDDTPMKRRKRKQ